MEKLNEKEEYFIRKFYPSIKNYMNSVEIHPPYDFVLFRIFTKREITFLGKWPNYKPLLKELQEKGFLIYFYGTKRILHLGFEQEKIIEYFEYFFKNEESENDHN